MMRHLMLAVAVVASCGSPALAALSGSDNFNDNTKDTSKWGADTTAGAGVLTETNGRLEFNNGGISNPSGDIALRPWILNSVTYAEAWNAQVDLGLSGVTSASIFDQAGMQLRMD